MLSGKFITLEGLLAKHVVLLPVGTSGELTPAILEIRTMVMAVGTASGLVFSRSSLRNLDQLLASAKALILLTHLRHLLCTLGSQPGLQILIAGGTHAGLTLGITAAFTFLFLLGHHSLGQVVAILFSQNAADLAVLPEEAHAAALRLFRIVPDPVDQNGAAFRIFSHHDILHKF